MFLSDAEAFQAFESGDNFLLCLTALRRSALRQNVKLFNITPKSDSYLVTRGVGSLGLGLRHAEASVDTGAVACICFFLSEVSVQSCLFARSLPAYRLRAHKFRCDLLRRLELGSRLNPRYNSCWGDESFVGLVSKISKQGHASTVAETVLIKWMLSIGDRWGYMG
jgi:hypothetical protein